MDPVVLSTEIDISLGEVDADRHLILAAFQASAGDAFEELTFGLERDGSPVGETVTFDTLEAAAEFFEDTLFDLGGDITDDDSFRVSIEVTLAGDAAFGMGLGFAIATPEPGTNLLLVFGLVVLGVSRNRRVASRLGHRF